MVMRDGALQVGDYYVEVGQAGFVYAAAGPDQRLDVVVHVPHVDVHPGHHHAVGQPERDELAPGQVTPVYDLVVGIRLGEPGRFHAQIVLVAVEIRHRVVADPLAQHGPGRRGAAVQRVGPVLHPDVLSIQGVVGVGDVPGRE